MKIKFKTDVELEVVESIEDDIPVTHQETFKAGEEIEIDVIGQNLAGTVIEIQFGDGSVVTGLDIDCFELVHSKG